MATILNPILTSRTPESIALWFHNDGTPDVAPLIASRALLLSWLRAGPLFEIINRTADLSTLNFANQPLLVEFYLLAGGLAGVDGNVTLIPPFTSVELRWVATGLSYAIWYNTLDASSASDLLVELRAVHSNER